MQNYEEIVADVISLLSQPDGLKKLRERRKFAAKMANALEALDALKPKRKMTRGAVLTVNQGSLQNGKRGLRVFVELQGQRVGEIIFPGPGSPDHPVFTCTKPTASAKIGAKFQWSLNRKDGDAIKKYLASCETLRPQPERSAWKPVVRWMLATKEPGTLTGLRPVMPAGCMMEMPVAVTANLAVGTGNIDILARSGRGRAGRFIACELKAPDANVKSYLVLRQAIRYAAALDAEINGISNLLEPGDRATYRRLFGATGQASLRFGALAIVAARENDDGSALKALRTLRVPRGAWVGVLSYHKKGGHLSPAKLLGGAHDVS